MVFLHGKATIVKVLTIRFHYLISDRERRREELPISPLSATSARGKFVSWKSQLLALIYEGQDIVILNLHSGQEVGRIEGAGGAGCQEVLYDVRPFIAYKRHKLSNSATQEGSSLLVSRNRRRIGRR
jgi:hypothetical protein